MKNSNAHQNVWFFLTPRYESIFLVVPLHILFCNKSYSATISQSRFLWNSREVIQFFRHFLSKQVKKLMSKYFLAKTVFITWTNCTKKRRWILHFEKRIVFFKSNFSIGYVLAYSFIANPMQTNLFMRELYTPNFHRFLRKCLDASMHLFEALFIHQSVSQSVLLSFRPSVPPSFWWSVHP